MSKLFILIFLVSFGYIIYYIINLLIRERMVENFVNAANGDPMFMMDETNTRINDLSLNDRNSHYFLMTSIPPGKVDITNLKERNPNHSSYYYIDDEGLSTELTDPLIVKHRESKLSYPKISNKLTCIGENHPLRTTIQKYQPYMFDKPDLINYYDQPFYRDWRYPLMPIDVRFATNPEKYCEQFPHVYPCYKYYSKW